MEIGVAPEALKQQTEHFLDHHKAKGSRFSDWNAAWRTWMRKVVEFSRPRAELMARQEKNLVGSTRLALNQSAPSGEFAPLGHQAPGQAARASSTESSTAVEQGRPLGQDRQPNSITAGDDADRTASPDAAATKPVPLWEDAQPVPDAPSAGGSVRQHTAKRARARHRGSAPEPSAADLAASRMMARKTNRGWFDTWPSAISELRKQRKVSLGAVKKTFQVALNNPELRKWAHPVLMHVHWDELQAAMRSATSVEAEGMRSATSVEAEAV
ncbi:MAG TPA: hypothetical protein VFC18_18945 [Burkholderiales bacterium]|nr:hypothetical protein [Burkholderiales bacterium]